MPQSPLKTLIVDAEPWFFNRLVADKVITRGATQASSYPRAFFALVKRGPFQRIFLGPVIQDGELSDPGRSSLDVAVVLTALNWRPIVVVIHHPDEEMARAIKSVFAHDFVSLGVTVLNEAMANMETS